MSNVYASTVVAANTTTIVATFTTPIRGGAEFRGFIGWGTADADYVVLKNNVIIGGGRTSSSERTLQMNYAASPYGLIGGDIIVVTAAHDEATSQTINCNLLVELL